MSKALLVFPSNSPPDDRKRFSNFIAGKIRFAGIKKIILEPGCIVFIVDNVVEAAESLQFVFGIKQVAVAMIVSMNFNEIVRGVVHAGRLLSLPGEKFWVQVQDDRVKRKDFLARDIEFASSGSLSVALSAINSRPAKTIKEANRIIFTYLGSGGAYVCQHVSRGSGGLEYGYYGSKMLCTIFDADSAVASFMALQSGFLLKYVILYSEIHDLKDSLSHLRYILRYTGRKKIRLSIAKLVLSDRIPSSAIDLAKQRATLQIMLNMKGNEDNLLLPLRLSIHPLWFVRDLMESCFKVKKIPYLPFLFWTDESLNQYYDIFAKQSDKRRVNLLRYRKYEYKAYELQIDRTARNTIGKMKNITLNTGSNFIHEVIDSI